MGVTNNYNWNIGIKGQNPYWDEWEALWTNVDTELYKRTKDLYMQNNKIYGSEDSGGDLKLYSTSHGTKGKIYLGANTYFDETTQDLIGLKGPVIDMREFLPFGFVIDGSVDYATQLQAAFTAAGGKDLFIPPGIWASSVALTFPQVWGTNIFGAGRNSSKLLFIGATDGVVFPDYVGICAYADMSNLTLITSNAGAGKAICGDFTNYSSSFVNTNNILVLVQGSGRWQYGLYAKNWIVGNITNLRVYLAAVIGVGIYGPSNVLSFFNPSLEGANSWTQRDVDIDCEGYSGVSQWFGGIIESYCANSLIKLNPGAAKFYGTYFLNTNSTPSDGADIVMGVTKTTAGCSFYGTNGASFKTFDGVETTNILIQGGVAGDISWGNVTNYCLVDGVDLKSYVDSGRNNRRVGCRLWSGGVLANLEGQEINGLTPNSTTPDVSGGNFFFTQNSNPTTITNFINGKPGQKITVIFADGNTTVHSGWPLYGNNGVDFVAKAHDWMEAVYDNTTGSTNWHCTFFRGVA